MGEPFEGRHECALIYGTELISFFSCVYLCLAVFGVSMPLTFTGLHGLMWRVYLIADNNTEWEQAT